MRKIKFLKVALISICLIPFIIESASASCSNYTLVNPGESIQTAIDGICNTGGTVELAAGTHNLPIGTTFSITKPNFILKGQGKTSTFLDGSGSNNLKIRVGTEPPNLTQPESSYLNNITISNFYIKGGSGSNDMGIRLFNVRNYNISNMEITAVYYGIVGTMTASGNINNNYLHNTVGTAILGNQMNTTNISQNTFDGVDLGVQFNRQTGWGNLDFAGTYNIIDNNTFHDCKSNSGCIFLYSATTDTTVKNNLINYTRLNGITIYGGGRHEIYDNKIYGVYGSGTVGLIAIEPETTNNNIYRNILNGSSDSECINIKFHIPPGGIYKSPTNINIFNNVLSGCTDGFSDSYNSTGIFKNNIVVTNSGYGIKLSLSKFVVSYNDVWNNALGNYSGTTAGTGDISADPRFADLANKDFHLKSQGGRWTPAGWVTDSVTSRAIGVGDPTSDNSKSPWGGVIEMGAYGNTPQASKSLGGSYGNVTGNVTNKTSGTPIVGAIVTDGVNTITTDALGNFSLASVNNGSRDITASKTGYQAVTKTINVVENSNVIVDFQLETLIPPAIISFLPSNLTPSQDESTTNTFDVTVNQTVTNKWFLDSIQQSETSQSYTKTWSYADAGIRNITYSGENANGTVSKTWNVTVIDFTDATPPTITLTSPENREYSTNIIPLTYYANEPVSNCIVTVDSTANQSLTACENFSVISREYAAASNTAAWWHFNESSGNLVMDSSGNANTGAISGASWTAGKFGSALQFNGLTNYIEVPDSNVLDGGSQITLEAWVKPVLGARGTIVAKYTYNSSVYERVYELDIDINGKVNFALNSNGTYSGTVWLYSSSMVINNKWNHIVATSDGTLMKIYINGVLDPNTNPAPSSIHSSPYNLQIGAWRYDTDGETDAYFNGVIDEVRILKKALTEDEVNADYALSSGSHNVTVYAVDLSGNMNSTTRYFTILDTTPPANITSLQNITYAQNYINWTWNDPSDADFSRVMVYLNGTFMTNVTKGEQSYNATGLTSNTSYTISTHTVDTSGNINLTWVNHTARTAPASYAVGDNTVSIADNIQAAGGNNTTVPIMIYNATGIGSVGINLTYNAGVVNVTNATGGDFTNFFGFDSSNASMGWVTINTYITGTQLTGSIAIANVTLEATGSPGDASPLNLKVLAMADQNGTDVQYSTDNGTFAVAALPHPPVLDFIGDRTVDEGQYLNITANATDPDGDSLTYSANNLPSGAAFNQSNRTFSWNPGYDRSGTYPDVQFRVSDGNFTDTENITITVNDVNRAPAITSLANQSGEIGIPWNYDISSLISDPDGDSLTVETDDNNISINGSVLTFNYSVMVTQKPVMVQVRDGMSGSNQTIFATALDTTPPRSLSYARSQSLIPVDTDGIPAWGENSTLIVTVTDNAGIAGVAINLSSIGDQSAKPMVHAGNNVWSVTINASGGVLPKTHNLEVNITDIYGNSNISLGIPIVVMLNGDTNGDNNVNIADAMLLANFVSNPGRFTISSEFVADVTGSGDVNIADAMLLANYVSYPARYVLR